MKFSTILEDFWGFFGFGCWLWVWFFGIFLLVCLGFFYICSSKELGIIFVAVVFKVYLRPLVIWKCKCCFFSKKHLGGIEGDSNSKGQIILMFIAILLG